MAYNEPPKKGTIMFVTLQEVEESETVHTLATYYLVTTTPDNAEKPGLEQAHKKLTTRAKRMRRALNVQRILTPMIRYRFIWS